LAVECAVGLVHLLARSHLHVDIIILTKVSLVGLSVDYRCWGIRSITFEKLLFINSLWQIITSIKVINHTIIIVVYLHNRSMISTILDLIVYLLTIFGSDKVVSKSHIILSLLLLKECSLFIHLAIWTKALLKVSV